VVGANSRVLRDNRGQNDPPEKKNLEGASREDAVSAGRGNQFFRFSNEWIRQRYRGKLPTAGKAVLPAIASYCNSTGNAWPSEKTIAKLCDVTKNTVRRGIEQLSTFPGFCVHYYTTEKMRRMKT